MDRTRAPIVAAGLLLIALTAHCPVASAQEATPPIEPLSFPLSPDASLCTTAPRPIDEIVDAWLATPGSTFLAWPPTEATVPLGRPADEATVDAIIGTTLEYYSCVHAGGPARASGLLTDDFITHLGPPLPNTDRADIAAVLETPGWQGPGEDAPQIVAVADVMVLADGRAGAFVVDAQGPGGSTTYVIFEQHGQRWLLDEVIPFMWYLPPSDDE